MDTRHHRSRRVKSRPRRLLAGAAGLVRAANRRDGLGAAVWVVITIGAVGVGGLAAMSRAGPALPSGPAEATAIARSLRVVEAEAAAAPADATPHLKRAYLEDLRGRPANAAALNALRRSYALEPLGPDATVWRLRFVFNHWPAMPVDLRQKARIELAAAFPRHGWAMRELPQSVSDPTGRMVAVLMFEQLRRAQAEDGRSDVQ